MGRIRSQVSATALLVGLLATPVVAAEPAGRVDVQDASNRGATSESGRQAVAALRDEIAQLRLEFDRLRQQYGERLLALEQRLGQLGGPVDTPPVAVPEQAAPAQRAFNPDISVIGNFVGVAGRNPFSDEPAMALEEVETSFQAVVDPYARADFFLAAGPDGLEVEEAFITFTGLPANLLLKAGKMRAQFGKMNTLHTHRVPMADRPLVTDNLLGGEEGLSDAGLSLSHLIPTEALFLEVTGEVFAGTSELFQSPARSRLNYVGRLRAYRDLTESTNLDVGTSFAYGPTDAGADVMGDEAQVFSRQLFGLDATLRYRPLRRAIYRGLNVRTELIWSRQQVAARDYVTAFGFYGLGEYQFARRWYIGGRLDRSARPFAVDDVDTGGALFLTFWPTEFSQIRGQYRRVNFAEGLSANELLFQFNFSIGAHGAHVF